MVEHVNYNVVSVTRVMRQVGWCPPNEGWIIINTDGVKKENNSSGCGGVLRGSNAEWCGGFAKGLRAGTKPLMGWAGHGPP
ncbi:putative non-LTR retroelement reverse transcriptase [Trifolium medium]|uniref:Putative non-LTR retroelement reverse transcriptase n=1 Tax=Trifolium medium TaxID=97028 RepID=A0A392NYC2_9FABA|nr:putative non-LTR retroelement reverse transcriptase [Trifolium medium]